MMDDDDEQIRLGAFIALERLAESRDAPTLLRVLHHIDSYRRYYAAMVLEHLEGDEVLEALAKTARTDADEGVRARAAGAYARHAGARRDLIQTWIARRGRIAAGATAGLLRRGGPGDLAMTLPVLLQMDWWELGLEITDAFAKPPQKEWIVPMRKLVAARETMLHEEALKWLGRAHDRGALPLVRAALRSRDTFDKRGGIFAAASLPDPTSIPRLVALLRDDNYHVRIPAARALTVLHAHSAYDDLADAAQRETEEYERSRMTEALEALRSSCELAVDEE